MEEVSGFAERGLIDFVPNLSISEMLQLSRKLRRASQSPEAFKRLLVDRAFPPAPAIEPSGARHIRTVHELIDEGAEMQHCIGDTGFLVEALRGEIAVFRVTAPVRATLALRREETTWQLEELRGRKNSDIADADRARIVWPFEELLGGSKPLFVTTAKH